MVDRFATSNQKLKDTFVSHASTLVAITRGAQTTSNVHATRGKTEYTEVTSDGASVTAHIVDWLIPVSEYKFGGVQTLPVAGDVIRETATDGTVYHWEVRPHLAQPAWRHSDPHRNLYRMHVKLISVVSPP